MKKLSPQAPLLVVVSLCLLTLASCADSFKYDKPTNVILIVLDTLRADHLGSYGSDRGLTPNLDHLASTSIVFENAVATSSWTRPSIASMLTSKYPTSLQLFNRKDALPDEQQTLAEILKQQAGLATYGVSTSPNSSAEYGFGQGYDAYVISTLTGSYTKDRPIPIAEGVNAEASRLLDQHSTQNGFFLFLHYLDPHAPYLPHPELETSPAPAGRFNGSRRRVDAMDRKSALLTDDDRELIKYLYAGEVKYLDVWLGKLFDDLETRGLREETMIVVTSDHGEGLWDHGLRDHGNDLYEETVHVPLLVHYPGMTEADSRRISHPVSLVDITPTILEALRVPAPTGFQGRDLADLVEDEDAAEEFVLSEMDLSGQQLRSIRRGDLKLIETGVVPCQHDVSIELFDVAKDGDETANLAGRDSGDEARLAMALARWRVRLTENRGAAEEVELAELDPETLDSLRALGYLSAGEHQEAIAARESSEKRGAGTGKSRRRPRPLRSVIDFSHDQPSKRNQILYGLQKQGASRRVCRRSAVELLREKPHRSWQIAGQTRPPLAPGETISLTVLANGIKSSSRTTATDGEFLLTGAIIDPPDSPPGSVVELTIECERSGAPQAVLDRRPAFCASISRVELK